MTGVVPFQLETVKDTAYSLTVPLSVGILPELELFTLRADTVPPTFVIGISEIGAPAVSAFACTFVVNVTCLFLKLVSDRVSDASNEYPVYTFPSGVASLTPPEYIVSVVPGIDGEILHPISSYTMMLLRVRSLMDVGASG
jgi:hypothetical protein